jgi:hypothetical protein
MRPDVATCVGAILNFTKTDTRQIQDRYKTFSFSNSVLIYHITIFDFVEKLTVFFATNRLVR